VAVTVRPGPNLSLGQKKKLFNLFDKNLLATTTYAVALEGSRFSIPQLVVESSETPRILIIQSWFEEFRQK